MAPLIGITATPELRETHFIEVVTRSFVLSVTQAGGIPVLLPSLPPDQDPAPDEFARALIGRLDGVLLSGGGDVVPALYGQDMHPETQGVDNGRDAFERALIVAAADRDVPLLGVCRGIQIINVDAGGTLIQHLPDVAGEVDPESHREAIRIDEEVHAITIEPDSLLRRVVGTDLIGVNTLHHQAIDQLGDGLVVTARSPGGVIEAVESSDGRRMLAVQWHPELLRHLAPHAALFGWLVAEASGPRRSGVDSAGDRRPVLDGAP